METWVDLGEPPTQDDQHHQNVAERKIMDVWPRGGEMPPGHKCMVTFTYKHDFQGEHTLPVLIDVQGGKKLNLTLVVRVGCARTHGDTSFDGWEGGLWIESRAEFRHLFKRSCRSSEHRVTRLCYAAKEPRRCASESSGVCALVQNQTCMRYRSTLREDGDKDTDRVHADGGARDPVPAHSHAQTHAPSTFLGRAMSSTR